MANLGQTSQINYQIQFCTLDDMCITHYHNTLKDAEEYHNQKGLTTSIWQSDTANPNTEFIDNYNKSHVRLKAIPPVLTCENFNQFNRDKYISRYSKMGY